MFVSHLLTWASVSVLLCFHGVQTSIPIYDIHLDNLLKMQHGIGWPVNLRVTQGLEALMRLTSTLPNMQSCEVTTPTGVHFNANNPPDARYERWSDGCGLRVKNVSTADQGRWRLDMTGSNETLTGWTDVHIEDEHSSYAPVGPITLQDGQTHAEVDLTTLENAYCLVTQPFTESSLVPGHCRVTLDRTTRAVQGRWNVVLGLPGKVAEVQVERDVAVETEQLQSGYREETSKLHLFCNILHTQKNITFCRFQKNTASLGFNIVDGLSDGRYSYYGEGFAKRQCGMTIETPTIDDFGVWKCTVGLQEWIGNTVTQSTPMQALFRVTSRNFGNLRANERSDDQDEERTIFVEKESSFTIMCRAEESLAYCWFQHPNGTAYTPVERHTQEERSFWYTGESLQMGDCGVTFAHVSENDTGEWICHMGPRNYLGVEVTEKVVVRVTGPLAANTKEVGATVGDEATLYCHTANGRRPLDYCRFLTPQYVGISIDSTITAENAILNRFYFTPERSLDYGDCSLTIKPVLSEDIGEWTCAALLHDGIHESWDSVVVYASGKTRRPLSSAGIVGMAFGVIILAVVLAGTMWYKRGKLIPWRRTTVTSGATELTDDVAFHVRSGSRSSNGSDNSNEEPQIRTNVHMRT